MSAVATATPAMRVDGSCLRELPSPPANPPASATRMSHTVGLEFASSSFVTPFRGDSTKYRVDVARQMQTCMRSPTSASRRRRTSAVATEYEMASTEPMSGQMSMAPTMHSVESVFRPMEAMSIATMRMQRCVPLSLDPFTKRRRMSW